GRGGHNKFFYHLRVVRNDFLNPREVVVECAELLNERLRQLSITRPTDGFEPWDDDELEHKIDNATDGEPDPDFPPAGKLPRAVDVLRNFALVNPTPKQFVPATGTVTFSRMAQDGKSSVMLLRDGRAVYSNRFDPWSEKPRRTAAAAMRVTPAQVLWMAEQ